MSCQHDQDCIYEDHKLGEEICVLCGQVLAERLPELSFSGHTDIQDVPRVQEDKAGSLIKDITDRGNFTLGVAETCEDIYTSLKSQGLFKFTPIPNLVAYSFYVSCFEHNVPRTMGEISGLTGVPSSKLWQLEKRDTGQLRRCLPSEVVERFASHFEFSYKEIREMQKNLLKIEQKLTSKSVKSVTAAMILCYLKHTSKYVAKKYNTQFLDVFGIQLYQVSKLSKQIEREINFDV